LKAANGLPSVASGAGLPTSPTTTHLAAMTACLRPDVGGGT